MSSVPTTHVVLLFRSAINMSYPKVSICAVREKFEDALAYASVAIHGEFASNILQVEIHEVWPEGITTFRDYKERQVIVYRASRSLVRPSPGEPWIWTREFFGKRKFKLTPVGPQTSLRAGDKKFLVTATVDGAPHIVCELDDSDEVLRTVPDVQQFYPMCVYDQQGVVWMRFPRRDWDAIGTASVGASEPVAAK